MPYVLLAAAATGFFWSCYGSFGPKPNGPRSLLTPYAAILFVGISLAYVGVQRYLSERSRSLSWSARDGWSRRVAALCCFIVGAALFLDLQPVALEAYKTVASWLKGGQWLPGSPGTDVSRDNAALSILAALIGIVPSLFGGSAAQQVSAGKGGKIGLALLGALGPLTL